MHQTDPIPHQKKIYILRKNFSYFSERKFLGGGLVWTITIKNNNNN